MTHQGLADVFLGVIGLNAVMQAAFLFGVAYAMRLAVKKVDAFVDSFDRHLGQAVGRVNAVTLTVARASDSAVDQARALQPRLDDATDAVERAVGRASSAVTRAAERAADAAERTASRVQDAVMEKARAASGPLGDAWSAYEGVRRGLEGDGADLE